MSGAPTGDTVPHVGAAETHSAAVFFLGDRAYKVKKPIDLGFLDFSTRERRQAACHREVELNRRLSPDVYLGVADVHGPDGALRDHLVVMRRMPPDRRLSTLVESGADVGDHLWHLAHLVATFHAAAERSPAADEAAGREALAGRWADSTATLRELRDELDDAAGLIDHVQHLADRYLAGRGPLLQERVTAGRACDGHGDMLADDIFCLDDGPRVLDCIEFDPHLRYGDVLADVAFLAMDLERLGRPDLAGRFLAAYQEHAADTWPASLAHHHIAYRAHVRAKVSAIRAGQGDASAAGAAPRLLAMTHDHLERARVRLVLVGGLPGTGKSTLAHGLGDERAATVLRSDEVRKELAGLPAGRAAGAGFGEGIYSAESTDATYRTVLARAETALCRGETVVLDASWSDRRWRDEAAAVAERSRADLVELRCEAPGGVAAERIRQRDPADPSDATPEVAAEMAGTATPWPSAVAIDTSGSQEAALQAALAELDRCPLT